MRDPERLLLSAVPGLNGAQRETIRAAAAAAGLRTVFAADEEEAAALAPKAEVVFTASRRVIRAAVSAKWVALSFAGADAVLRPGALGNDDAVLTCSTGAYGTTISEHVIHVTLDMMRRADAYRAIAARRGWKRDLPIRSICGSRVTILGTGDIGSRCAERLRAFRPACIRGVSRSGRANGLFDVNLRTDGLDGVLPETDLLIMALPATPETAGLMDARRLALLPEDAFLVNVGRGSALDELALEARLRAGKLGGAALDVFAHEPLDPASTLWDCPRLLITPHVSGNMTLGYTVQRITDLFAENLARYGAGEPLAHVVDRALGYAAVR